MDTRHLVDIGKLSNGQGAAVYGGHLRAYSFENIDCAQWFDGFSEEVLSAVGKRYLPIYRIADGELRFLFGMRINWKNDSFKSILRYVKYEILRSPWETSWGEKYPTAKIQELRSQLKLCAAEIAQSGKIAIYWNENGLNAFTEYNSALESLFNGSGIKINSGNYVPFHFCQGLLAQRAAPLLKGRNVLIVSGLGDAEYGDLERSLLDFGCKHVELHRCSKTSALMDDYSGIKPTIPPDLVLVAAGIGAAKVLVGLRHLSCPVIDIGSYIHVLSGKNSYCHAGFFVNPFKASSS